VLFFCGLIVPVFRNPAAQGTATPAAGKETCAGGPSVACSAVDMTDAVTPLETEQADHTINLANSLAKEKRYREALETYQEFVRVFPLSPRVREARENMARIYERRQRYDRAIVQYEALYRELGISQVGLLYHLEAARLHEIAGNEEAAVNIYKEINQIDPGSEAAAKARTRMDALNLMQKTGDAKTPAPEQPGKAEITAK